MMASHAHKVPVWTVHLSVMGRPAVQMDVVEAAGPVHLQNSASAAFAKRHSVKGNVAQMPPSGAAQTANVTATRTASSSVIVVKTSARAALKPSSTNAAPRTVRARAAAPTDAAGPAVNAPLEPSVRPINVWRVNPNAKARAAATTNAAEPAGNAPPLTPVTLVSALRAYPSVRASLAAQMGAAGAAEAVAKDRRARVSKSASTVNRNVKGRSAATMAAAEPAMTAPSTAMASLMAPSPWSNSRDPSRVKTSPSMRKVTSSARMTTPSSRAPIPAHLKSGCQTLSSEQACECSRQATSS